MKRTVGNLCWALPQSPSSSHQTATQHRQVKAQHGALWELSCPSTFRCSSLMLILWRCQPKTKQAVRYARRGRKVWEGADKELEKVRKDTKCFEWVWQRRVKENREGRKRGRGGVKSVPWIRMYRVNGRERAGGGEQEGTQWRGCISRTSQADYSAATSFFNLDSAFPSRLCPLLSLSLFSHFLDRCSKYPSAVNSNRSFNDTSRHWQVLSSCATIGRDLRKDKIGPTNSDNKEHIMARRCFHTVLHCHLVLGVSTGAPIRDADRYLQSVTVKPCTGTCRSGKGLCTCAFPSCSVCVFITLFNHTYDHYC